MIDGPYSSGQLLDALAGGLGGMVKWMGMALPWKDGVVAILVGAICATYLAPIGDAMLEPILGKLLASEKQANHLGGFVVGIIGIGVVGFIMGFFKTWQASKSGGAQP